MRASAGKRRRICSTLANSGMGRSCRHRDGAPRGPGPSSKRGATPEPPHLKPRAGPPHPPAGGGAGGGRPLGGRGGGGRGATYLPKGGGPPHARVWGAGGAPPPPRGGGGGGGRGPPPVSNWAARGSPPFGEISPAPAEPRLDACRSAP